jgi:hypothetical protein
MNIKTWPELNTEVRDVQDGIVAKLKAVYFMYLTAVAEKEQLSKQFEEYKKQNPIILKKGGKK